jgi:hypothetical protein
MEKNSRLSISELPSLGERKSKMADFVYAKRRTEIGMRVLEAFTIGDRWDIAEAMEFAEVDLLPKDFLMVELHTQGLHSGKMENCIICILEGKRREI